MKLTERKIELLAVEPGRRDRLVFDDVQRGLAVRVTASGGRTYLAQYTLAGQKHRIPLGAFSALSLSKAREAASVIMGDVAKGKNPASERKEAAVVAKARAARDRQTLGTLIDDWHRLHLAYRRPRYATEAVRALRYAFARYIDRPADELDRVTVVRVLDGHAEVRGGAGIERAPTGNAIANRTAAYGRAAFSWAVKRGTVQCNPFLNLPAIVTAVKRERVLTDEELAAIWRAAGEAPSPYGTIVRMLILTGQRREEVAGMTWVEIGDDLATWTIPGTRAKNGALHLVPLSEPARGILRGLLPEGEPEARRALEERRGGATLVLPGNRGAFGGWSKSKARLDAACGVTGWRLHDLRRTLATGLQRLGVRLEVTEAVLNHVSGSRAGIVGVYQRHDWAQEKRIALDAWATHIDGVLNGRDTAANIIRANFGQ